MGNELEKSHHAAKASRLVWVLVLLGLGTSAFTLYVIGFALGTVREQRARRLVAEDAINDLTTDINHQFAEAQSQMEGLLSGRSDANAVADWISPFALSLQKFRIG